MKHVKLFEAFSSIGGKYPKRPFEKITTPVEPFKRDFTEEETEFMFKHFKDNSWSKIDAEGRIVLGGGLSSGGMFYITETDLAAFMADDIK